MFTEEQKERRATRYNLTKEDMKEAVREAFEVHARGEHHAFIAAWLEKEKRKQELLEKIKAQVAGWATIGILGYIAVSVWRETLEALRAFFQFKR